MRSSTDDLPFLRLDLRVYGPDFLWRADDDFPQHDRLSRESAILARLDFRERHVRESLRQIIGSGYALRNQRGHRMIPAERARAVVRSLQAINAAPETHPSPFWSR